MIFTNSTRYNIMCIILRKDKRNGGMRGNPPEFCGKAPPGAPRVCRQTRWILFCVKRRKAGCSVRDGGAMSGEGPMRIKRDFWRGTLCLLLAVMLLAGCGAQKEYDPLAGVMTTTVTDSCGRQVEVPAEITAVAASGGTAQMILMTIAPDLLVGLSSSPSRAQRAYFPESMWYLPTFGQFYGSKASLNLEALLQAKPQVIIDLGDKKLNHASDMNTIQRQTGIPTIFIEATLEKMPEAYRMLGQLLGREEKAEELAQFIEKTVTMAQENAAKIPEGERKTVLFGTGSTGLACNAAGSSQADVIDIIGAVNAIIPEEVTNRGGGTQVSLEEVYLCQPDVILLTAGGPYDQLAENEWAGLNAVRAGSYYEIPSLPYDWMASPPSVNRVLGIWWLGNLLYPELYDYDMVEVAQEYYRLFWNYDLTAEEAEEMLARSTLKGEVQP